MYGPYLNPDMNKLPKKKEKEKNLTQSGKFEY